MLKWTSLRKIQNDQFPALKVSWGVKVDKLEEELAEKTRNHDRNEVLRVAWNPNPVFNEMWFLTVDPIHMSIRVHRKAFLAIKLLAYPRGHSLSEYTPIL